MTKLQKRLTFIVPTVLVILILVVFRCIVLPKMIEENLNVHRYYYSEYKEYADFEIYMRDFETLKNIVKSCGNTRTKAGYKMNAENRTLFFPDENLFVDLTVDEQSSLYNIVTHSDNCSIENIYVIDDCIVFYAPSACGVMYTEVDIEDALNSYSEMLGNEHDWRFNRLSDNWYAVYY